MQFLADQDVYTVTISFLRELGHEVVAAAQLGMAKAKDVELLRMAHNQGRIFIIRDRDFGALVFVQACGPGDLRILPATQQAVHTELARALTLYSEQQLQSSFVAHRARQAPHSQGVTRRRHRPRHKRL